MKCAAGVTQVVEHLPNKCKAVSSNSSTTKRKKRKTIYEVFISGFFPFNILNGN
jgi:hypothetical protein